MDRSSDSNNKDNYDEKAEMELGSRSCSCGHQLSEVQFSVDFAGKSY